MLDAMGGAAELMSSAPRLLEGAAQDPAHDPRVMPHKRLAAAASKAASRGQPQVRVPEVGQTNEKDSQANGGRGNGAQQGTSAQGKTRVWGVRSLATQGAALKRTYRNRCGTPKVQSQAQGPGSCALADSAVCGSRRDKLLSA